MVTSPRWPQQPDLKTPKFLSEDVCVMARACRDAGPSSKSVIKSFTKFRIQKRVFILAERKIVVFLRSGCQCNFRN
ncbi:hypothetical protein CEXT_191971 [Caerostris extrusa]|uniref:Uncharacterized protein n=1 Tax=Caerostris extrusa TaxID=172846 RepID=A0AAV4XBW5_CAEEX|nr:hypothetical protein CEXT_191971 [Caerostris extrusa]